MSEGRAPAELGELARGQPITAAEPKSNGAQDRPVLRPIDPPDPARFYRSRAIFGSVRGPLGMVEK